MQSIWLVSHTKPSKELITGLDLNPPALRKECVMDEINMNRYISTFRNLCVSIGADKAMVLTKIVTMCFRNQKDTLNIHGTIWTNISSERFTDWEYFPWINHRTVQNYLAELVSDGFLISQRADLGRIRPTQYRPNPEPIYIMLNSGRNDKDETD